MKKFQPILLFFVLCIQLLPAQDLVYNELKYAEHSIILPFLGDSLAVSTEQGNRYLHYQAGDKTVDVKFWEFNQQVLMGIVLSESDIAMLHEEIIFFLDDQRLNNASILPELNLGMFFDADYLRQQNISEWTIVEDPVYTFSNSETISISLQDASFDTTYMGTEDLLTHLDLGKISCENILLSLSEQGTFYVSSKTCRLGNDLSLQTLKGMGQDCNEPGTFISLGSERYLFNGQIVRGRENSIQLLPQTLEAPYDSVKIAERVIFAYGKMRSETEGIDFFDTTFYENRDLVWYTYSDFMPLVLQPDHSINITGQVPKDALLKSPAVSAKMANAAFKKRSPNDYDFAPAMSEASRNAHSLKMYAYMVEVNIVLVKSGQRIHKTLLFKIRHGEC